ncbi:peptide deformylase [Weissella uvarum]|uniref:peptide deformylase n=1 Tax=Weissella uvarum TaxID=1479233 RepID=UPI00195F4A54|nr:peptide deformylase [Weissella uvarum]MBM7617527.1 peptide deformylase [Weissella uvarum]MCM0595589.1 peptide deformylase [Weissella uvarum]
MYRMDQVVRDGDPVLRKQAEKVAFPLSDEDQQVSKDMMEYLIISQDEKANEKYGLRPGVGLAAPQVGVSKQYASILIPNADVDGQEDQDEPYYFKGTIYNPVITRQSVKQQALAGGEGCLSVDADQPGFVERSYRITVRYQDETGAEQELKLQGYPADVFQHEIDHLHGTLYYDHINEANPWEEHDRTRYI